MKDKKKSFRNKLLYQVGAVDQGLGRLIMILHEIGGHDDLLIEIREWRERLAKLGNVDD